MNGEPGPSYVSRRDEATLSSDEDFAGGGAAAFDVEAGCFGARDCGSVEPVVGGRGGVGLYEVDCRGSGGDEFERLGT